MTGIYRTEKVVGALPSVLLPNTVYYLRTGDGFDIRVTDSTGSIAHTLNASASQKAGQWHDGEGAPEQEVGAKNDYYIDTSSRDIYRKADSDWLLVSPGQEPGGIDASSLPWLLDAQTTDAVVVVRDGNLHRMTLEILMDAISDGSLDWSAPIYIHGGFADSEQSERVYSGSLADAPERFINGGGA